jgi:6,7-dimethyl-8-ribityllumazine synthase
MSENRPQLADTEAPLTGARFLVIASQFNGDIVAELKAGAVERLQLAGVTVEEIPVPGALEIPVAAAIKLDQ